MSRRPDFYEVRSKTGMLRSLLACKSDPDMMMEGDVEYPLARIEPWSATRRRLAKRCKAILEANGLKVGTKTAAKMIHMYYAGALAAIDDEGQPWVLMCLMSGRHDELLKED